MWLNLLFIYAINSKIKNSGKTTSVMHAIISTLVTAAILMLTLIIKVTDMIDMKNNNDNKWNDSNNNGNNIITKTIIKMKTLTTETNSKLWGKQY